jgi:hypothetical protein
MMNTEEQYRQEWATKAGRAPSDVYIPEALRKVDMAKENELRRALGTAEIASPLAVGDRVRILARGLEGSATEVGDILTVVEPTRGGFFYTDTPSLVNVPSRWIFPVSAENTGWERVR